MVISDLASLYRWKKTGWNARQQSLTVTVRPVLPFGLGPSTGPKAVGSRPVEPNEVRQPPALQY